ncbi:hypothetical protein CPB85DRAFT_823956 [Mucidula mucida]|nr:hypothetical protein CPB85DRAFT_823956 [Mucidula mucida]
MSSSPRCNGMQELPDATEKRANLESLKVFEPLLAQHLSYGLAYTVGSALGSEPPTTELCLEAFTRPHNQGNPLTTGARAWSKHAPRSQSQDDAKGWWGRPSGPVAGINEQALQLFWKVMDRCSWRNLHWLPRQVLVYEVRIEEGYGMRWSQDRSEMENCVEPRLWIFRGFVEPMMENGHEVGWRH